VYYIDDEDGVLNSNAMRAICVAHRSGSVAGRRVLRANPNGNFLNVEIDDGIAG